MEAFKKWWKEQCIKRIGNKQAMYIAEDAYQYALEWALTQKLCSDEGWYIPPDVIKKELAK